MLNLASSTRVHRVRRAVLIVAASLTVAGGASLAAPASSLGAWSQCTTVGWVCEWMGTNYSGTFYPRSGPWGEWMSSPTQYVSSFWNHRNQYVTWISNVKDYDTSTDPNRAEACVPPDGAGALFPSAFPDLTGYIYPVGPGYDKAIKNHIVGLYMSGSRTSCPNGTTPYTQ